VIKPISGLQYGDLVYYQGQRWQCSCPTSQGVSLICLEECSVRRPNIALDANGDLVSVYATREPHECLPF
jgi:hypothetical protein